MVELGDQTNTASDELTPEAEAASNGLAETPADVEGNDDEPRTLVVADAPVAEPETEARTSKYRVAPAGIWIAVAVPPEVVTPTITFPDAGTVASAVDWRSPPAVTPEIAVEYDESSKPKIETLVRDAVVVAKLRASCVTPTGPAASAVILKRIRRPSVRPVVLLIDESSAKVGNDFITRVPDEADEPDG